MAESSSSKLIVRNLGKAFRSQRGEGQIQVFDGVSFDVRPSEFISLVGPSGCGKWLEANRDKAVRFLMAVIKGMRYLNDPKNKEEVTKIMAERMKLSPKYAEMSYELVVDDLKAVRNDAAPTEEAIETVIKLEHDRKKLDKLYPPDTFIDDSYRKEALKRLDE